MTEQLEPWETVAQRPTPWWLSKDSGAWRAHDATGAALPAVWAALVAIWWRTSPAALYVCTECGEPALAGKRRSKKCHRCKGKTEPVDLDALFDRKRPKARKVKLDQ